MGKYWTNKEDFEDYINADDFNAAFSGIDSDMASHSAKIDDVKSTSPYVKDGEVYVDIDNKVYGLAGKQYHTYGVSIDLNNSNPRTSVTYINDAVGMVANSPDWYKQPIYKDLKPCVHKSGKVVDYLNPDNLDEFTDGTLATLSGKMGHVMLEIPKLGYRIAKSNGTLTVQVTDEPNKDGFTYKAHTRTTEGDRDKLYVGAFLPRVMTQEVPIDDTVLWESNFEEGVSSEHATNNDGTTNNNAVKPVGWDYAMTANDLSAIAYYENTNTTELKLTCGPWGSAHLIKNVPLAGDLTYELSFKIRFANDGHADQFWVCLNNDPETKAEWPQDNTRVIGVRQEEYSCIVSANTDFGAVTKSISPHALHEGVTLRLVWNKSEKTMAYYIDNALICEKPFDRDIQGFRFFSSAADDYTKTFYLDDVKWTKSTLGTTTKWVLPSYGYVPIDNMANTSLKAARSYAKNNGKGYDLIGFHQATLLQCLMLIKMKNLDCVDAGGAGYGGNYGSSSGVEATTGSTTRKGMDYIPQTDTEHVKCLGLEDAWGALNVWIDGIKSTDNFHVLVGTDNFNSDGEGYTDIGALTSERLTGYIKEPQGDNNSGFLIASNGGSSTTYFCGQGDIDSASYAYMDAQQGLFGLQLAAKDPSANVGTFITGRLMYL